MKWEHGNLLWLLLVIPPLLMLFFWWALRARQEILSRFIEARLLSALTVGVSPARQKVRFAFLIVAVMLLIAAIAQPQYGYDLETVEQNGLDIVVAIDTSKSMLATDIVPDRLERAKLAALELMQRAGADRLGLVAFAGDAFLECPLTVDNAAFQQSVQALDVNSIPEGGTDLADAINTALTAFKESGHHKALVLLTDGEDNESETGALEAAKNAAKSGLKIFTVGIGTAAGDLIRITDANGNSDYVRDDQGNVVKSHLNEPLLRQIATISGGFYLPLQGADTMDALYERGLAPLPKSESEEKTIRRYHEQFQWFLVPAILLLLAEMFLPERSLRTATNPKTKAAAVAILLAFLFLPNASKAAPSDALKEYDSGNFTNALADYEQLASVYTNDLRYVFNAGAAAYRATNFDEAVKNFTIVAAAPDLKMQQQAYYNLGNTQYRQGELKFEPSEQSLDNVEAAWKEAAQNYAHAAQLDTNDVDAAYNYDFVKKQMGLIEALRDAMRHAKADADAAVRRADFHTALEIMESLKNPIATKKFQDYIKKLKDIDEIATPHQS